MQNQKITKIFNFFIKYYIFPNILTILNENLLVVSKFCYTFATVIKNDGLTFKK